MARVGLDIGGTKTAAVLVDRAGNTLAERVQPTGKDGVEPLLLDLVSLVDHLLDAAGLTRHDIESAGIGFPGLVDPEAGTVQLAVNLDLSEPFPLAGELAAQLQAPVHLENDVRAAALGVHQWLNESQPVHSLAYLSIGTGIAAGLVLDDKLYRGAHGMAGEIGHLPVDTGGPKCRCGGVGCLEAIASGPAIASRATLILTPDVPPITTREVYELAAEGVAGAVSVVSQASYFLARAIYLLVMSYDVEKVVVGGGVTQAGEQFWQPLTRSLGDLREGSDLAAKMLPEEKVILLPPDFKAGAYGAALLPLQTGVATSPWRS